MGEDGGYAIAFGDAGHRGHVRGQRDGRQRALADDHRVDELHRDVLGVGAGPPVPNTMSLPPRWNLTAMAWHAAGHGARLPGQLTGRVAPQLEQAGDLGIVWRKPRR